LFVQQQQGEVEMLKWMRQLSPSMVVALIALFFALGGVAGAATYAIVPLAKRALVADNAKKLSGKTSSQLVAQAAAEPGPASSAAGLLSYTTNSINVPSLTFGHLDIACPPGAKAVAGGFDVPTDRALDTFLLHEGPATHLDNAAWEVALANYGNAPTALTGYAVCLS
jgi:hypothetical protein